MLLFGCDLKKEQTMKKINFVLLAMLVLSACATDKYAQLANPQKVLDAVSAKYPSDRNT